MSMASSESFMIDGGLESVFVLIFSLCQVLLNLKLGNSSSVKFNISLSASPLV